jgi:DNA repair photolyase
MTGNEDRRGLTFTKGRGALSNREGRFAHHVVEAVDDGWPVDEELPARPKTELFPDKTKEIIARNRSPDIGFEQSINPYKGCEHGCVYCYARPTHAYLDLSPGLDFETKIFFKTSPVERLREALDKSTYECKLIALGANTDPYQPVEKELKITRRILETLLEYRHPISIVTKGSLIERDLDLLGEFAKLDLVNVMVSVTSLDARLKTVLEPRAAGPRARLRMIRVLADVGVPVGVLMAPVIPCVNDEEIEAIAAAVAKAGARSLGYVMLRLPHEVKELFREWLATHLPERAEHVMAVVRALSGGKDYDSRFGIRQRGQGPYADLIARRFQIARRKFKLEGERFPELRTDLFRSPARDRQLGLF